MSEEIFLLPDVGEGLVEAEIVTWKVAVGDVVTLNQPLVDIETAKATVELPSPYAGTVVELHGNVGDVMEVHKPLITFEVGGNATPTRPRRRAGQPAPSVGHEQSPRSTVAKRCSSATALRTKRVSRPVSTVVAVARRRTDR